MRHRQPSGGATIARLAVTSVVVALAALGVGCASDDSATDTSTTAPRVAETLPATNAIRVAMPPDVLPSIATELVIASLQAQGALVTREPMALAGDAIAALVDGRADLAVLVTADPAALDEQASAEGWVVLDPFPGDAGGGSAYPVITAASSQEFGDLLEATIGQATSSTDGNTLAVLARDVVEGGRPTAEVIEEHLIGVGLIEPTATTEP